MEHKLFDELPCGIPEHGRGPGQSTSVIYQFRNVTKSQMCRMLSSTSDRVGMLGIAPAFCTHSVAAEAAKRSASSDDCEFSRATANAAVKQSPAPVVSTTLAAGTACCRITPDSARNKGKAIFELFVSNYLWRKPGGSWGLYCRSQKA